MANIRHEEVDPRKLKSLPTPNPNVMDPASYESLVAGMKKEQYCLQPLLLVEEDDGLYVVDGEHRKSASIEAGLSTVPAVITDDRERAEILRIALNKTRGELDISEVQRQMHTLLEEGFTKEDLTYTGFQDWEVTAMLDSLSMDEDEELLGSVTSDIQPEKPKTYSLNIKFETESERARVREFFEDVGDGNLLKGIDYVITNYGGG